MRPVQWTVDHGQFCLAPKYYENLALNTAELMRWMLEARERLNE